MSADDLLGAFEEFEAARQAREAKKLAEMFIQPAICVPCGALVAIPLQHKAFHDAIEEWMKSIVRALEKAGFQTAEQRAQRRKPPRTAASDG